MLSDILEILENNINHEKTGRLYDLSNIEIWFIDHIVQFTNNDTALIFNANMDFIDTMDLKTLYNDLKDKKLTIRKNGKYMYTDKYDHWSTYIGIPF